MNTNIRTFYCYLLPLLFWDKSKFFAKWTKTLLVWTFHTLILYSFFKHGEEYINSLLFTDRPEMTGLIEFLLGFNTQQASEQECKNMKIKLYKLGFPAVFEDMTKIKSGQLATTRVPGIKISYDFDSLEKISGIYMITNKVTKKIYIGMTKDLKMRIYSYLNTERLKKNKSLRINRALLKYGHNNFSFSIIEFHKNIKSNVFLREREDLYIKVFKPQYNIKRSIFNLDNPYSPNKPKIKKVIPTKIKNILDLCLDPKNLEWILTYFRYFKEKRVYIFKAMSKKEIFKANSLGWHEGKLGKEIGLIILNRKDKIENHKIFITAHKLDQINIKHLKEFYTDKKADFVGKMIDLKLKAFYKLNKPQEKLLNLKNKKKS